MPKPNTTAELVALRHGVPSDAEFERIDALPRRTWTEKQVRRAVRELTALLKTSRGTQTLWDDQAVALSEIDEFQGLAGGIRVSGGKTPIAFLTPSMPHLCHLPRPLLLCPSKSIRTGKVADTFKETSYHWRVRKDISWLIYDLLHRKKYADYQNNFRPGILILDEGHHAGRYDSSRTKRIERFHKEYPEVPIIILTGSLIASHVVSDSQRLCWWALGQGSPLPKPTAKTTARYWRMALEVPARTKPGVLGTWGIPVRKAVGRRYYETPGVVCSSGKNVIGTSLVCETEYVSLRSQALIDAFGHLRAGRNVDGGELLDTDGSNTWTTAQTLGLGFYYVPDPPMPTEWRDAFRNWCSYCREVIAADEGLDTEGQVIDAVQGEDCWPWEEWAPFRAKYKIRRRAVWLSDERVKAVQAWMRSHKHGLVWTQFKAFGLALSPYYGAQAKDRKTGLTIVQHKAGSAAAASIKVCSEDLNLQQQFYQNLFPSPMATGAWHEQTIARSHRFGCARPEVTAQYWLACSENVAALDVALQREQGAAEMTGDASRKLLIADWRRARKPKNLIDPQWKAKTQRKAIML